MVTRKLNTRWILAGAILLLLSIVVTVARAPSDYWQSAEYLGTYLQSSGATGLVLMLLLSTLAIAVGLPRQVFAFVFGFGFGASVGFFLALGCAVAGCVLTYTLVRFVFSVRFQNRYPEMQRTLATWVREDVFLKIVILRFQPLGTNLLTNVCAGLVPLPAAVFFASSAIGFIPQSLVFSLLGSGVRVGSAAQMWTSLSLLALSLVMAFLVYRRAG